MLIHNLVDLLRVEVFVFANTDINIMLKTCLKQSGNALAIHLYSTNVCVSITFQNVIGLLLP